MPDKHSCLWFIKQSEQFCVIVSGKIIKTNTRQCYELKITEAELIEKTQSMMKSFKPKSVDTCIPLCS